MPARAVEEKKRREREKGREESCLIDELFVLRGGRGVSRET